MKLYGQRWRDTLNGLRYPFDTTNAVTSTDGLEILDNALLDLSIFVQSSTSVVELQRVITDFGVSTTLIFAVAGVEVGRAVIPRQGTGRVPIELGGINAGFLLYDVNAVQPMLHWSPGSHEFGVALVPHVVVVSDPAWRRGVRVPGGEVVSGEVWIVGRDGVRVTTGPSGIVVSAPGDPYAGRVGPRRVLTEINGVSPDADGNINLVPQGVAPTFRLNFIPLGNGRIKVEVVG